MSRTRLALYGLPMRPYGAFLREIVVAGVYAETPAGRGRRRRYVVEVDGREFVTESLDEAQALLDRAVTLAEKAAQSQAESVAQKLLPKARITGKADQVKVKPPTVTGPVELGPQVNKAREAIQAAYRAAAMEAEIALLLQLEQEQDDEEILLLM